MSTKDIIRKKEIFDLDNGHVKVDFVNKTPIDKITTVFQGKKKEISYLEELKYHVARLNPGMLREFKLEQKDNLIIKESGLKAVIIIINKIRF